MLTVEHDASSAENPPLRSIFECAATVTPTAALDAVDLRLHPTADPGRAALPAKPGLGLGDVGAGRRRALFPVGATLRDPWL